MKPMMKYMTLVFILFLMTSGLIACGENAEESQDSTQSEHTELVTEPETETEIDSETETEAELETETETETETEAETETDPAQSESEALSEYRYDLHEFTIVRPKGKNSAIDQVVGEMYEAMISMGIDEPMVTNDDGLSPDPSRKEILIGATNQPESEETAKRIKEINEYAIAFYENKIVISVARDEAYPDATEALLTGCFIHAEGGVLSVERDHAIVGKASFQTVTLYQNKKLSYNVVLPKKPSEADQALAGMIVTRLEQYTGILADIIYAGDVPYNKNTKSILIGDVGYPECAEAYEGLEKNECAIRVVGNKIVLCGRFIMTREWACNLLLTKMAGEWSPGSDSLTLYVTEDWKGRDNSLFLDFPEFTDGEEVVAADNENQTVMLGYEGVSKKEFEAFCEKILQSGYVLWQKNEIGVNLFRTYRQNEKELCLAFYPKLSGGTMHVFADAHEGTVIIPEAEQYEKVREATLYNISFDYSQKSIPDGYGMSYVIALEDGRYIVMDGGYNKSSGSYAYERLYRCLSENNQHPSGKIVIAAWFMSHPHGDHYGAFETFTDVYGEDVTIECFVANPYSYKMNTEGEWFTTKLPTILNRWSIPLIKPHTGQILTFCNTELEVVFTHENLYPDKNFGANNASTVIRLRQNGHTALFSADACAAASKMMVKLYGEELKSEIFQVNHHGHSGGTWEFYDTVTFEDSYVLWTCPEEFFYYRTLGYYVDGKSIVDKSILQPNRDLALKVGFERNFYAEGVVESFTFPENGAITVSAERDITLDPATQPQP